MVQHLIVPVDGSDESWRAVDVALGLAERVDAHVDIVEVVFDPRDVASTERRLDERLARHLDAARSASGDVTVTPIVRLAPGDVVDEILAIVERRPGATVVMASHGRGRSAALLGSVAEDLLHELFGPVVIVGPNARTDRLDGPIVVTVDGSETSEAALPLAAAWGIEFGATPWVVQVLEPDVVGPPDVAESAYPARLAHRIAARSHHPVEFDVLHGRDVAAAVAEYAGDLGAGLLVASTHGRTGLARFVMGSTAAEFVRLAPCPVVLVRPPHVKVARSDRRRLAHSSG